MGVSHIRITANGEHVGTYATTTPGEVLLLRELVRTINLDSDIALAYETGFSDLDGLEQLVARLPEYHSEAMHRAHMLDQVLEPVRAEAEAVLQRIKQAGHDELPDDVLEEAGNVMMQLRRLARQGPSKEALELANRLRLALELGDFDMDEELRKLLEDENGEAAA